MGDRRPRGSMGGGGSHLRLHAVLANVLQDRAVSPDILPGALACSEWLGLDGRGGRSEEHTSELQSQFHLVCRLLLEKKKKKNTIMTTEITTIATIMHSE